MAKPLQKITATKVRYIKLGKGGEWAGQCFRENSLRIGHSQMPHSLASTHDREAIRAELRNLGFSKSKASDLTRELLDFDLRPNFPPVIWKIRGLVFGLMRPAFANPFSWQIRWV